MLKRQTAVESVVGVDEQTTTFAVELSHRLIVRAVERSSDDATCVLSSLEMNVSVFCDEG